MKRIGLISGRKSGKWTYYSINGTKMVENHDKFKRLVYNAVEERINKGMPASPVLAEGDGYCSARVNTSLKSNNSK